MTVATVLRGLLAAGPLVDRDRRLQALDQVDVGPLQLVEELPGVDREAFDILPLPLGIERVEGQRALARAAGAGDRPPAGRGACRGRGSGDCAPAPRGCGFAGGPGCRSAVRCRSSAGQARSVKGTTKMSLLRKAGCHAHASWACAWTPEKPRHGQTSLAMAPPIHSFPQQKLSSVYGYGERGLASTGVFHAGRMGLQCSGPVHRWLVLWRLPVRSWTAGWLPARHVSARFTALFCNCSTRTSAPCAPLRAKEEQAHRQAEAGDQHQQAKAADDGQHDPRAMGGSRRSA